MRQRVGFGTVDRRRGYASVVGVVLLALLVMVVAIAAVHAVDLDHHHAAESDACGICSAVLLAEPVLHGTIDVELDAPHRLACLSVPRSGAAPPPRLLRTRRARAPPRTA